MFYQYVYCNKQYSKNLQFFFSSAISRNLVENSRFFDKKGKFCARKHVTEDRMQSQASTTISSDTNALKRKLDDARPGKSQTQKRARKENWEMDDDLAFLQLVLKYKHAWDLILNDFKKFQHRRPDETEETLEKHWKNLIGKSSKYAVGQVHEAKPFKASRKMDDLQLEQAQAAHEEEVRNY